MFIFPFIYVSAFLTSLYRVLKGRADQILIFFILALPIYITSLSVIFSYGASQWITFFQSFKEILVLVTLATLIYRLNRRVHFHLIDKAVLAYFFYVCAYILLPLGNYGIYDRLVAVKGISFFPLLYFIGRLIDINTIVINRFYYLICGLTIAAAGVLLWEVIFNIHFQTFTGYADYNLNIFGVEPAGHYGLTWTFEAESGLKRFESFFSNPLEFAAATLVSLSVILALSTTSGRNLKMNKLTILTSLCAFFSIVFALSRASFASYFLMLYAYAVITRRKKILTIFYASVAGLATIGMIWIKGDLYDFIINSVSFSDSSSLSHLIEWLDGINAIISHPLGMGLGESGRVSGFLGLNTGGENQFIIIGVQVGVIGLFLYLFIYAMLIRSAIRTYRISKGRLKKICMLIATLKIGLIIPLLTSEAEVYLYVSYITWFFSGLMVNMICAKQKVSQPLISQSVSV